MQKVLPEINAAINSFRTISESERALARPLESKERDVVRRSYQRFLSHYDAKPAEAKKLLATGESPHDTRLSAQELAAWTMVASQVLNLDEALNK